MKAKLTGYHEVTIDFTHWTSGVNPVTITIADTWLNRHGKQYIRTPQGLTYRIDSINVTLEP